MRPILFILILWRMPCISLAQSASIDATIAFQSPSPSCSISGADDLSFGTLEQPVTGSVSVTVNAESGAVTTTPTGYKVTGASVGDFQLSGSHVSSYTIRMSTQGLPTALVSESRRQVTLSPISAVTRRSDDGTTWSSTSSPRASGQFDSGTAGGHFSTFTRYFRIGGTISGIALSTPHAKYSATITLSLSCS